MMTSHYDCGTLHTTFGSESLFPFEERILLERNIGKLHSLKEYRFNTHVVEVVVCGVGSRACIPGVERLYPKR